jgi:spermidine/putrescine transport system substrate-binding protein
MKGIEILSDHRSTTGKNRWGQWIKSCLLPLFVVSALTLSNDCRRVDVPASSAATATEVLVYYGFAEDMPQSVLDAFGKEYGISMQYLTFQSPEEAEEQIRSGQAFDVALIENQLLPVLIKEHHLAQINLANVPNFKNISANFRDLAIDPGNRYSVPASYGTTGLVVRTDLVGNGLKRWADLWRPQYSGKIGLRAQPREIIGMTLTSLGYPFASEDPRHLAAVQKRLLELKPAVVMLDIGADDAVRRLLRGEIAILHGYAEDYQMAHGKNPAVSYVLPQEGMSLWGESYTIPASGRHRRNGELFINFLLRPEITAQIINEKKYAQPNDPAIQMISQEIRNDPVIFPGDRELRNGSIIQPLSPEGKKLYADIWTRFMAGIR